MIQLVDWSSHQTPLLSTVIVDCREGHLFTPLVYHMNDVERQQREKARGDAREKQHDQLSQDADTLFQNLTKYMKGELGAAIDEFKLLEQMNVVTKDKYAEMTASAAQLTSGMQSLQKKYELLQPYLTQIDEIDGSLRDLEETVHLLDEYTARLEQRFVQLQQRAAKVVSTEGRK